MKRAAIVLGPVRLREPRAAHSEHGRRVVRGRDSEGRELGAGR